MLKAPGNWVIIHSGMELRTGENDSGRRLDRVLRKALRNYPLPLLYRFLRQGLVLVDGKPAKAQDRVACGAVISIPSIKDGVAKKDGVARKNSAAEKTAHSPAPPVAQIPDILWQGQGLLAVNKPVGLPVHGPDSMDTLIRSYLAEKLPASLSSLSFRPGPLHRLDKPSSGIVVFSTSIEGARYFSRLLREHKVRKTYLALVEGVIENEEIWQDELVRDKNLKKTFVADRKAGVYAYENACENACENAKTAITRVRPLALYGKYCLIMAEISTGRTHQIRAQAGVRGHPLAGDRKYGGNSLKNPHGKAGFFLHAWKMEFQGVFIEAPLPPAFKKTIAW